MKRVYHLHNSCNNFNKFTADEKEIIIIYINELAQCIANNLENAQDQNIERTINHCDEEILYAKEWLNRITLLCYETTNNEIEIDKVIKRLNTDHNWNIEVYSKEN